MFERNNRNRPFLIRYICIIHLYDLGLSLRNTSKALEPLVDRSYVATIWYWIQKFNPKHIYSNKRKKTRITLH